MAGGPQCAGCPKPQHHHGVCSVLEAFPGEPRVRHDASGSTRAQQRSLRIRLAQSHESVVQVQREEGEVGIVVQLVASQAFQTFAGCVDGDLGEP